MHLTLAADVETTRDHWYSRPEWVGGREKFAFHLTLEDSPALHALVDDLSPIWGDLPAAPVAVPWLHLTMRAIASTEEVNDEQLDRIRGTVFSCWDALDSPSLRLDQLLVTHESPMLTADIPDWLVVLDQAQRSAVEAELGPRDWSTLWPHLSLAYFTGNCPAAAVRERLAGVAASLPAVIEVAPRLTLMRQRQAGHSCQWQVVQQA